MAAVKTPTGRIEAHPIRRCTDNQRRILRAILEYDGIRQSHLPHSTVLNRTLNTLRDHGLIESEWDTFVREHRWYLTEAAKDQIKRGYTP